MKFLQVWKHFFFFDGFIMISSVMEVENDHSFKKCKRGCVKISFYSKCKVSWCGGCFPSHCMTSAEQVILLGVCVFMFVYVCVHPKKYCASQ